jgi:hypothetical protein
LQAKLAEHACQLQMVQFWITGIRIGHQDLDDEIRTGRSPLDDLEAKILAILNKSLFESVNSIVKRLIITHLTVLLHLHDSIGSKSFHLCRVPQLFTDDLGEKRKDYARTMLPFLSHAL